MQKITKIILDTNFLLIPFQFKVDIFEELAKICDFKYKLYIVDKTLDELEKVSGTAKKGFDKKSAKLALKLIKTKDINIITTAKHKDVDNLILDLIKEQDYIVATQDKPLKARLKENNAKRIILRQKKYLTLIG
ncbi:nucleotide-binding protein [Candidatus Woesearchaeota archaeon]|nr:nucleotide-binding protein [Candidatus Woesearchaeota archaeon]